jgi:hypothetical protein
MFACGSRLGPATVIVVSLSAFGCGSSSSSTTTPSQPAQVAGEWTGTITQFSATGSECASLIEPGSGNSEAFTLTIAQSGSSLTATDSGGARGQCTYQGSGGATSIFLTATACGAFVGRQGPFICNGQSRAFSVLRVLLVNVSGSQATGSLTEDWSIFNGLTGSTSTDRLTYQLTMTLSNGKSQ